MLSIRRMDPTDAAVVARIHADSWRSAYRGILRDEYLDDAVDGDRLALWMKRFAGNAAKQRGFIAEDGASVVGASVVGFAYVLLGEHSRWGHLLDNLHVAPRQRGSGVGRALLQAATAALLQESGNFGLHLWVFEQNEGARRFYERLGAKPVDSEVVEVPGGGSAPAWCYAWTTLQELRARLDDRRDA